MEKKIYKAQGENILYFIRSTLPIEIIKSITKDGTHIYESSVNEYNSPRYHSQPLYNVEITITREFF